MDKKYKDSTASPPALKEEHNVRPWFEDFDKTFNQMLGEFQDIFGRAVGRPMHYGPPVRKPMFDFRQTDTGYEARFELPGVKREDISLSYENEHLIVSTESTHMEKKEGWELYDHTGFYRALHIPGVDDKGIVATYENGVLQAVLPLRQRTEMKRIPIGGLEEKVEKKKT